MNAVVVQMALAAVFFVTQIFTGGGINWGAMGARFQRKYDDQLGKIHQASPRARVYDRNRLYVISCHNVRILHL